MDYHEIQQILGAEAENLLTFNNPKISKELLHKPSYDSIDEIFGLSNRNPQVLRNLSALQNHGRLAGMGYPSILPVDQRIGHSTGSAFAANPLYFENIIKLTIEGGCNAVATTFGNLAMMSRKYAYKIPFIVKINHNELLTYPTKYDQIMFGKVEDVWNLGAITVGATIYFESERSGRQITEVAEAFESAHQLGMTCILWYYTHNNAFKKDNINYEVSADITGQANHFWGTIQADIIKQKLPENNGVFTTINFSKSDLKMYSELASKHPIDLCRYQIANCYVDRV